MRIFIGLALILFSTAAFAQSKTLNDLGKSMLASIEAHDSIRFYELVLPKEAVKSILQDKMNSELTSEELKSAREGVDLNYEKNIRTQYGLAFLMLTTKVDIHNFNFDDVEFQEINVSETEFLSNLVAAHANLNHETYKHISFFAYQFEGYWYLFNHIIRISEENAFHTRSSLQAINLSEDEQRAIQVVGSFEVDPKEASQKDILSCLDTFPISIGKEEVVYGIEEGSEFYMKGNWEFPYYVNRGEDSAGLISFNFIYGIEPGKVNYKLSFFVHQQDESEYSSIGLLPLAPNERVLSTFTEMQYQEILDAILLNARTGVNSRRKLVNRCLKQK